MTDRRHLQLDGSTNPGAAESLNDQGRATVMVLFGTDPLDPDDVIGLTVPDANQLISALRSALDAPLTTSA